MNISASSDAKDGISAIVAPNGKVLAQIDHYKDGSGVIVAQVPLYSQVTLFSRFGHWPVSVATLYLTMYIILMRGKYRTITRIC